MCCCVYYLPRGGELPGLALQMMGSLLRVRLSGRLGLGLGLRLGLMDPLGTGDIEPLAAKLPVPVPSNIACRNHRYNTKTQSYNIHFTLFSILILTEYMHITVLLPVVDIIVFAGAPWSFTLWSSILFII